MDGNFPIAPKSSDYIIQMPFGDTARAEPLKTNYFRL